MDNIRKHICQHYYPLDFTLDGMRDAYRFNETCQNTVPQAIEAFLEAADFEDAIRNAVSLGGDSDTLAAIAGGMAEAKFGIPDEIRNRTLKYLDARLRQILDEFESATFMIGNKNGESP